MVALGPWPSNVLYCESLCWAQSYPRNYSYTVAGCTFVRSCSVYIGITSSFNGTLFPLFLLFCFSISNSLLANIGHEDMFFFFLQWDPFPCGASPDVTSQVPTLLLPWLKKLPQNL